MGFNIINATRVIGEKYKRYLKSIFDIKDPEYKEIFNKKMAKAETFVKGPYLDVVDSFEKGRSIKELINCGVLHSDFSKLPRLYNIPNLYSHQEESILKVKAGNNVIVSTGTGSGKTESFLMPILNKIMSEKDINPDGKISRGIKAVIIYPMNALANDQIDRLRKLFLNYPEITFGAYTGQTKEFLDDKKHKGTVIQGALSQYKQLNGNRKEEELRNPLPNELLSREQMHDNPPHILITNYAMLEFLLLKPQTSNFFIEENTKNWNFIVLDEAHTYTGSTGIEVSMLLRRLKAAINRPNIQYILTSATLGDEKTNSEVIEFAENLCSSKFYAENIIRAKRYKFDIENPSLDLGINFYTHIDSLLDEKNINIVNVIKDYAKCEFETECLNELLYKILMEEKLFWKIKKFMNNPKSVVSICEEFELTEEEITSFINVSSLASKDGIKIFDARYHSFIRAVDGVFITLPPHKNLFLHRKSIDYVGNKEFKVFEVVNCTSCNALYLIGNIKDNGGFKCLEQTTSNESNDIKSAFLINSTASDDDDDNPLEIINLETEPYELCPYCGFIREGNIAGGKSKPTCGHPEEHFVKLTRVKPKDETKDTKVTKCIACENVNVQGNGILRGFFSGHEASTSVIGTALFEQIPAHTIEVVESDTFEDDGFGEVITPETKTLQTAKQFIAFSDNRAAAAYYASYLSLSYENILGNKLILDVLKNSTDDLSFKALVNQVKKKLEENGLLPVEDYLKEIENDITFDYKRYAMLLILRALTDINSKNSLLGMGLISLDFIDEIKFIDNKKYNLSSDDIKNLCLSFVSSMLADSATTYDSESGTISDLEVDFAHAGVAKHYQYQLPKSGIYDKSFYPSNSKMNKRVDYVKKVLESKGVSADTDSIEKLLNAIWQRFLTGNVGSHIPLLQGDTKVIKGMTKNLGYQVDSSKLKFTTKKKIYICDTCKKITFINIENICPNFKCKGKLVEYDINTLSNNHYFRIYNETAEVPMRVVEHTAQLNRDEAYRYQNLFKDQKLDILSCSTTFEMGVDVGDLETVFMRNMPPSPSNYAQRAGRAGRSSTSAAFALTFCNKSNHDFNYYNNPIKMINGTIYPPQFKTDNEKIGIRHLYSSALSYFFKKYPMYFTKAKDFIDICDATKTNGYSVLKQYLESYPIQLKEYLIKTLPENLVKKFNIENFGWIDYLYSDDESNEYPSLTKVYNSFHNELNIIKNEIDAIAIRMQAEPANKSLAFLRVQFAERLSNYLDEDIISFLSKNNILPKYGFPVDTVDLNMNEKNTERSLRGVELSRDMSQAIADYAPGCQIIANNRLITSRYIKMIPGKNWKMDDFVKCRKCNTLNVTTHVANVDKKDNPLLTCPHCGEISSVRDIKTYLIPEFGFIADVKTPKPTMIKPEKTYRSEASFVTNANVVSDDYIFGNNCISVEHIPDGEMAILNNQSFGVCETCGYAEEINDKKKENVPFYISDKTHEQKNGYPCTNKKMINYSLGYKFKTDVIRIKIDLPINNSGKELYYAAYSILQAIILSACKELSIEATEIAGCLQYYFDSNGDNYSYVLYDRTPGGAGHVKRINNKNTLYRILTHAKNLSENCEGCDPDSTCYSCLRTYQNQRHHDNMKREYVYKYISQILDGAQIPETESKLEEEFLTRLQLKAAKWSLIPNSNEYEFIFGKEKWKLVVQEYFDPRKNVLTPTTADFVLYPITNKTKLPVAIYTDGFSFHNDKIHNDSLRRNGLLFTGKYLTWTLSWNDVLEVKKEYSIDIFSKMNLKNKIKITNYNCFDLLVKYLTEEDSYNEFTELSNEILKHISENYNVTDDIFNSSVSEINSQLNIFNSSLFESKSIYKINDYKFNIFVMRKDDELIASSYLNDNISTRNADFIVDWNTYWHINNILQFNKAFVMTTEVGNNDEIYKVLRDFRQYIIATDDNWLNGLDTEYESVKKVINQCIEFNIKAPDEFMKESSEGYLCEFVWEDLKLVFLNEEQIEDGSKESFEKDGYIVIDTFNQIKMLVK